MANTYDRRTQWSASEKRYADAIALQKAERWEGAIYLGGYAIECSLKSLICYSKNKTVVTDIGIDRAKLHNLEHLLTCLPEHEANALTPQSCLHEFKEARNTILQLWKKDELRYGGVASHKHDCERFMAAVAFLYSSIMERVAIYGGAQDG